MVVLPRTNWALTENPPAGDEHLNTHGSNWLWAVTAVYAVSFIGICAMSIKPRHGEKIFHYLFSVALLVGSISYFAAASDLGFVVIPTTENTDEALTYQVFWTKYVNWAVSWPTVIIALGLLSGVSWATIIFGIFLSWTWIISYLVSAFTVSDYRWGFFAFGTVAYLLLACLTMTDFLAGAKRVETRNHYLMLAGWTNLLWLLYPTVVGITDCGNVIGVVGQWIYIGVLDVLMVPVLAFAMTSLSCKWDYGKLNIHFTQYGRVAQGGTYPEKTAAPATGGVAGETA